jgi:effector-binding domain-containing protein
MMIATPEIIESTPRPTAVIHVTIPRDQIRSTMPEAINEIIATLSSQGLPPAGPLFEHHLTTSAERFDFEVGFPVNGRVTPAGRVKPGEQPGGRIARTVYQGDYEGLFGAWSEFGAWMKREGHVGRGDLWEIFLAGPESSESPADWRTELCLPLKS